MDRYSAIPRPLEVIAVAVGALVFFLTTKYVVPVDVAAHAAAGFAEGLVSACLEFAARILPAPVTSAVVAALGRNWVALAASACGFPAGCAVYLVWGIPLVYLVLALLSALGVADPDTGTLVCLECAATAVLTAGVALAVAWRIVAPALSSPWDGLAVLRCMGSLGLMLFGLVSSAFMLYALMGYLSQRSDTLSACLASADPALWLACMGAFALIWVLMAQGLPVFLALDPRVLGVFAVACLVVGAVTGGCYARRETAREEAAAASERDCGDYVGCEDDDYDEDDEFEDLVCAAFEYLDNDDNWVYGDSFRY